MYRDGTKRFLYENACWIYQKASNKGRGSLRATDLITRECHDGIFTVRELPPFTFFVAVVVVVVLVVVVVVVVVLYL